MSEESLMPASNLSLLVHVHVSVSTVTDDHTRYPRFKVHVYVCECVCREQART